MMVVHRGGIQNLRPLLKNQSQLFPLLLLLHDMTEFNIIFKVKANDDEDNVSVTLYYGSSESSMTKTKTCSRYYGGSATATKNYIFFKSFVMGSSKSKIYYKGKVQNSVGSAETSTSYTYYK